MRASSLPLVLLALAACDASRGADAGADVVVPVDADAASDVEPDVTSDVMPDVMPDVALDVMPDARPDVEPFCDVPGVYTYGLDGGFVAFHESALIEPGRRFTYTRTPVGALDAGARTCTTMIDYCGTSDGGAVDTLAVINALNDPDVMAAFADQASTLYGRDARPSDGQVFAVRRGDGRHFEVGYECGGAAGCRAIPSGLARLRTVLSDLQTQQLARPECAGARP